MNLVKISQYRALTAEIQSIKEQLEELQRTYGLSSPALTGGGNGTSVKVPRSPTEDVIIRLESLQEKYETLASRSLEVLKEIEEWIEKQPDPEIKALCRYRYVLGYSWTKVAMKVYSRPAGDSARMRVTRFFKEKEIIKKI